jgi:tetratricopeptide (TPR) repeat protein
LFPFSVLRNQNVDAFFLTFHSAFNIHTTGVIIKNCNTMADRSRAYNNAGVACLESGREEIALDLFRGALEAKLSYERSQQSYHVETNQRCVTPDCLSTAEDHLANLPSYLRQPSPEPSPQGVEPMSSSRAPTTTDLVPLESRGYIPYLYAQPFAFQSNSTSTQLTSAIIVFNLGLVYQLMGRSAQKAAAFYEISAALLANEPDFIDTTCTLVRIAMMNNFGVWCYENGEEESLRTCMERLAVVLDCSAGTTMTMEVQEGVRSNIRLFTAPPSGASPAA